MTRVILAIPVLVAGCGSAVGPSQQDDERAYAVVWEGAFGMERESRPVLDYWWPPGECSKDLGGGAHLAIPGACVESTVDAPSGHMRIVWRGSFSASDWSYALAEWREYLMTGEMPEPSQGVVAEGNAALRDNGM